MTPESITELAEILEDEMESTLDFEPEQNYCDYCGAENVPLTLVDIPTPYGVEVVWVCEACLGESEG